MRWLHEQFGISESGETPPTRAREPIPLIPAVLPTPAATPAPVPIAP
jgi:hypothetical protein